MYGPRRSSASAHSEGQDADYGMNYVALGATLSHEVLNFPPEGFHSSQYRHRVGSGSHRFDVSGRALMTWGALSGAGVEVTSVEAERMDPAQIARDHARGLNTGPMFLPDGTPWITPGMTAALLVAAKGHEVRATVKVVCVIDQPGRIGFVYGSCPGSPVQMEQLLLLEHTEDDSVWVTMRTMTRPLSKKGALPMRLVRLREKALARRILTALHPAHTATQPIEIQRVA
jgi:uncharacterized protein (UPF0548 family)